MAYVLSISAVPNAFPHRSQPILYKQRGTCTGMRSCFAPSFPPDRHIWIRYLNRRSLRPQVQNPLVITWQEVRRFIKWNNTGGSVSVRWNVWLVHTSRLHRMYPTGFWVIFCLENQANTSNSVNPLDRSLVRFLSLYTQTQLMIWDVIADYRISIGYCCS